MKNSLDFNFSYNNLEDLTFIQRFATAYAYLETSAGAMGNARNPDIYGYCAGCRSECKKDEAAAIRCKFFFLFNTMSGNSAIRCRFDGKPTETQELVGDTGEEGHGCGSDFMIDFLFGYTGYEYRQCTDAAAFRDEVITAVNAGKPVIARVKSGNPRFYLINGYDGETLLCPAFTRYWNFETAEPIEPDKAAPDGPPAYNELAALYIFGGKTTRRYTLKDGLLNIRRAMERNIREHVLDGYTAKLGGWDPFPADDGFNRASPEERAARALRLHKSARYVFNIVSFFGAFATDGEPHSHYLHKELWDLDFAELSNHMNEQHWIILNAGHKFGVFTDRDWLNIDLSEIPGICTAVCEVIEEIKKADMRLLELINQAIALFSGGQR